MLNKNFADMLAAFNEAGVEYLLVGAYAMAAHGCPRATGDIDVQVGDLSVSVIGIHQLYANKLASGRAKDQLDAEVLAERLG